MKGFPGGVTGIKFLVGDGSFARGVPSKICNVIGAKGGINIMKKPPPQGHSWGTQLAQLYEIVDVDIGIL